METVEDCVQDYFNKDEVATLNRKTAVILISILNLFLCVTDLRAMGYRGCDWYDAPLIPITITDILDDIRRLIVKMFCVANVLLLIGVIAGNFTLLSIYVWYAMAFVMIGLLLCIADLTSNILEFGIWCLVNAIPEIIVFFVIYMCLPLVDDLRKLRSSAEEPVGISHSTNMIQQ